MLKAKLFYSHLVKPDNLVKELDQFQLSAEEKEEIYYLIDDIFHHRILDSLLDILPQHRHHEFLHRFTQTPHDRKLFEFLKKHSTIDPEVKILTTFEVVKREILLDIRVSKPRKRPKIT